MERIVRIILVRHGKTAGNLVGRYIGVTDERLCPQGAEALSGSRIEPADLLVVSPMIRCLETACALTSGLDALRSQCEEISNDLYRKKLVERLEFTAGDRQLLIAEDLRECDFGLFENRNYKELADCEAYQDWIDGGGRAAFPGGESPEGFKERTCRAFREILCTADTGIDSVNFVVHGGSIMSILEQMASGTTEDGSTRTFYDWHVGNGCGYAGLAVIDGDRVVLRDIEYFETGECK